MNTELIGENINFEETEYEFQQNGRVLKPQYAAALQSGDAADIEDWQENFIISKIVPEEKVGNDIMPKLKLIGIALAAVLLGLSSLWGGFNIYGMIRLAMAAVVAVSFFIVLKDHKQGKESGMGKLTGKLRPHRLKADKKFCGYKMDGALRKDLYYITVGGVNVEVDKQIYDDTEENGEVISTVIPSENGFYYVLMSFGK